MEVWVHSPHSKRKGDFGLCSRRTVSALFVLQLTLIVGISIIYLPGIADRKYRNLHFTDDIGIMSEQEVHRVLGLDSSLVRQEHGASMDGQTRELMSQANDEVEMPKKHEASIRQQSAQHLGEITEFKTVPQLKATKKTRMSSAVKKRSKLYQSRRRKKRQKKKASQTDNSVSKTKSTQEPFRAKHKAKQRMQKGMLPNKSGILPTPGSKILYSELYDKKRKLQDVDLLVIINSALHERPRRDGVRDTWMTECVKQNKVRCFFFTDDPSQSGNKAEAENVRKEQDMYKDMVFQPFRSGLLFGHRMLYQLQWARAHYKFKYLLRVDDDIMLCLHHLLYDLKRFRTRNLQWGYLHCEQHELVYIDEGIVMFTPDVVDKYLSQHPAKMRCHPFGDQTLGLWIQDLGMDPYNLYVHDMRIHHNPPASYDQRMYEKSHLCNEYIAIHGVYAGHMSDFWSRRGRRSYLKYEEPNTSYMCDKPFVMFWDKFQGNFFYKPSHCYMGDVWQTTSRGGKTYHIGRESEMTGKGLHPVFDESEEDKLPGEDQKPQQEDKESWRYSSDVMDKPKKPPPIPKRG